MQCPHPIPLKVQDPESKIFYDMSVPCGKCYICLERRRMNWVFRNLAEFDKCYTCYFVTLTYSDENIPHKRVYPGEYTMPVEFDSESLLILRDKVYIDEEFDIPTYSLRDMQLFLKRLRKYSCCQDIRYFWVSEYGGETFRPHYHMILYNFPGNQEDLRLALDKTWQKGFYYIGQGNEQTICYTCKYILGAAELPSFFDKPIMRCSRNPAIGKCYLTPAIVDYYRKRLQPYAISKEGVRCSLPRYLRTKIFDDDCSKEFIREKCEWYIQEQNQKEQELFLNDPFYSDKKFQMLRDHLMKLRSKTLKSNINDLTDLSCQ